MSDLKSIRALMAYSDKMNRIVYTASAALDAARLDQAIDIGLGSLRRILLHVHNGEFVWLARWEGQIETAWPSETLTTAPAEILNMLQDVWRRRDAFISTLNESLLDAFQTYRDSRGTLFQATLRDMILQGIIHSTHHRAQIVNAIRRLGGESIEVDYMVSVRQPA